MAIHSPPLSMSDSIDKLDLTMRVYNALWRNGVRTVADLVSLSEIEFLRMRSIGEGSLRDLHRALEPHGLSLRSDEPLPLPDPSESAQAAWIGEQISRIVSDRQLETKGTLWAAGIPRVLARRRAWAFYRWAVDADVQFPRDEPGNYKWMANRLPGGLSLHLEGLNRLAHEELGE